MSDNTLMKALALDDNDPLKGFRDRFIIDPDLIYLDGNSLGRLPVLTPELISKLVTEQWGDRLIRSWNEQWMGLPQRIASKIAAIVGAGAGEIVVGDSTTINLYKAAFASLASRNELKKVVSDELSFPADLYILQGLIKHQFRDRYLELVKSRDGVGIDEEDLEQAIGDTPALVVLSHVAFKSSFMYDMERINRMVHKSGGIIIWDLSHSAGAVPVGLSSTGADMAAGCTYKYLNGGPGAPAFLYVREDLREKLVNPITSWFSHSDPFAFNLEYNADSTIRKFATGTPGILSMAAIEPGLDIILDAGIERIREKSVSQSEFMIGMVHELLTDHGFSVASPLNKVIRGSHVSVRHREAYRISRAMIEPCDGSKPVIPDFRPPDNIRMGITPLYTSFTDIHYAITRMAHIVKSREFERFSGEKLAVT